MEMLRRTSPHLEFVLKEIKTQGDIKPHLPLERFGTTGVFARELENALISGEIDLAVHSMKDLPTVLPEGLVFGAIPSREDPRDVLVSAGGEKLVEMPPGARVGSGSLRRVAQLRRLRPDLQYLPLRGNLDTRLRRLAAGDFEAIVLARAGLKRMGRPEAEHGVLSLAECLPAAGQGALAVEIRSHDHVSADVLKPLDHFPTRVAVIAERAFLQRLQAGCQVPAGVLGELIRGERLKLQGAIAALDGSRLLRDELEGPMHQPEELGFSLAEKLLACGGKEILAAVRQGLEREC